MRQANFLIASQTRVRNRVPPPAELGTIFAGPLKPDALRGPLRSCGYRPSLLRSDFAVTDQFSVPLVGFAQQSADSRSACVVVIADTADPRQAVEASRGIGAPLLFVCYGNTLQWWRQGTQSAERLESIPAKNIESFFRAHQDEFSPEAVYRAKTLGRVRPEYQLSFVDIGVMPLLEEEVGTALSNLIARQVSQLKSQLGWQEVTSKQGQWLLHTVFWLISGKILRDKEVPEFENVNLRDIDDVFTRVAIHYGTAPLKAGSQGKIDALQESADAIERFSSLALTTTEALAHVYENTLISKRTRSQLGTHSTPSYLVDYIVALMADWIEEIPENDRSVFEPACGHAGFLVSAMRLLSHLLPAEKSVPSRRGPYLRSRIHGTDIDPFALELARLSLTLTDIPNPDGWDLRAEDMFVGDRLKEQTKGNTILLANPPFANFQADELTQYAKGRADEMIHNKAAEMLRVTLPELQPGSVFGLVLPQSILHGSFATDVRREIVDNFELREVSLFPDKVFTFSDAESAVLIGRKLPERSRRKPKLTFRRIRGPEIDAFRQRYETPTRRVVEQSRFGEHNQWDLRVPDLEEVWVAISDYPTATDFASMGQGLIYHGENLPEGVPTYSEYRFSPSKQGYVHFPRNIDLTSLPQLYWMNLAKEAINRESAGTKTEVPQILLNYARVSRGPWRVKALLDRRGRPVASRFIAVRPRDCSLEVLWAIFNSPIANAHVFCHLGKRDNIVGDMRKIPMPIGQNFDKIESAVACYFQAVSEGEDATALYRRMATVDAAVLRQYALPVDVEQSLLSLFTGRERCGVPFNQTRFLPEQLEGQIGYADFVAYESNWAKTNRRRGRLIDKDIESTLSPKERNELTTLQAYADYHLQQVAPRSTDELQRLEELVMANSRTPAVED